MLEDSHLYKTCNFHNDIKFTSFFNFFCKSVILVIVVQPTKRRYQVWYICSPSSTWYTLPSPLPAASLLFEYSVRYTLCPVNLPIILQYFVNSLCLFIVFAQQAEDFTSVFYTSVVYFEVQCARVPLKAPGARTVATRMVQALLQPPRARTVATCLVHTLLQPPGARTVATAWCKHCYNRLVQEPLQPPGASTDATACLVCALLQRPGANSKATTWCVHRCKHMV